MEKEIYFSNDRENFSLVAGVTSDGNIVIVFTNHSDAIKEALGNDYTYETHIDARDKQAVLQAIGESEDFNQDADSAILEFLSAQFTEHQDIRRWLLKNHIPFRMFHSSGDWPVVADIPTLGDAIALAKEAHRDQTDKAGAPYYGHLERVMDRVETPDAKIVAILHDSLEDTYITAEFLQRCGYPEHIIIAIEALTKLQEEENSDEGYFRFIERAAKNPLALAVKLADLSDNMDLSRIESPTDTDYARLGKYQRALEYLE
jgi:hypothetical protein